MDIPHEKRFHFRDGSSVGSIEELKRKLEGIGYQEFYHHVNAEKNDFANWIQYVVQDAALAAHLRKVSSIVETVEILNDALAPPSFATDDLQRKIEEESLDIHVAEEPPEMPASLPQEDIANIEALAEELKREEPRQLPTAAHNLSDHDYTRLIVKDFMYGLVFGLIIGLILGRIISL